MVYCGPDVPRRRNKPARKKIIIEILKEFNISEKVFFGPTRSANEVAARKAAIRRLSADGAYYSEIARLIKRDVTIVKYHLFDAEAHRRRVYYQNRYQQMRLNDPDGYEAMLKVRRKTQQIRRRGRLKQKMAEPECVDA